LQYENLISFNKINKFRNSRGCPYKPLNSNASPFLLSQIPYLKIPFSNLEKRTLTRSVEKEGRKEKKLKKLKIKKK